MPFRRWDPFQDLISIHQELFGEEPGLGLTDSKKSAWTPAVDVYETPESYMIKAELPGMEPDQIKLEYKEKKLVLAGERPPHPRDQARRFHQLERSYGPFRRTFLLPDFICCEDIDAKFEQGVLEITLPKKPQEKPKTITVRTEC